MLTSRPLHKRITLSVGVFTHSCQDRYMYTKVLCLVIVEYDVFTNVAHNTCTNKQQDVANLIALYYIYLCIHDFWYIPGLGRRLWTQYDVPLMILGAILQLFIVMCMLAKLATTHMHHLMHTSQTRERDRDRDRDWDNNNIQSNDMHDSAIQRSDSTVSISRQSLRTMVIDHVVCTFVIWVVPGTLVVPWLFRSRLIAQIGTIAMASTISDGIPQCIRTYRTWAQYRTHNNSSRTDPPIRNSEGHLHSRTRSDIGISGPDTTQRLIDLCSVYMPLGIGVMYCGYVFSNSFIEQVIINILIFVRFVCTHGFMYTRDHNYGSCVRTCISL